MLWLLSLPVAAGMIIFVWSPFGWTPKVPAENVDVASLAGLLIVAAVLLVAALATFRRRDVPA